MKEKPLGDFDYVNNGQKLINMVQNTLLINDMERDFPSCMRDLFTKVHQFIKKENPNYRIFLL